MRNNKDENEMLHLLENYEICKLDINRIYKYIEKYIIENAQGISEKDLEEEEMGIDEDCEE